MKKLTVLFLTLQLSGCSFADEKYESNLKIAQLEAEHSASNVLSFLPQNLKLIDKLDSKTSKDLQNAIFHHVLLQVYSLKKFEESGREEFSLNDQMTYRPHIADELCLINEYLISYKEKNPNAVLPVDNETFQWIEKKQVVLLKALENEKRTCNTKKLMH